jgi:predicted nucleic acid-binding protein
MIWVVDASVALRWFIKEESHAHADAILERIVSEPRRFAVPELFSFEVFAALHRLHPDASQVFEKAIVPLIHSGIFRQPMTRDLARQASHFILLGLTGYDACYAALARDLEGLWLTFDDKAHRLIKKEKVSCLLSEDLPENW